MCGKVAANSEQEENAMKGFLVRLSRIIFVLGAMLICYIAYEYGVNEFWIGALITFVLIITGINYLFLGQAQPWAEHNPKKETE